MDRIKNHEVLVSVKGLVSEGDEVSLDFAVLLVVETEHGLVAGVGNLLGVLGELNLRDELTCLFILYGSKLVDTAECRAVLGCDEVGSDTP